MAYDLTDRNFILRETGIFGADFPDCLLLTETLRTIRTRPMFWAEHLSLIRLQLQLLNQPVPDFLKQKGAELKRQIERCLIKNKQYKSARVSLLIFHRKHTLSYLIRTEAIPVVTYELNREGIMLAPFSRILKPASPLSSLRMGSAPYWNIARAFQTSRQTEPLLMNENNGLLEVPENNLYLICGPGVIAVAPGAGVYLDPTRETIRQICLQAGLNYKEENILLQEDLFRADEAFLAGSLYGIQWVKGTGTKRYRNQTVRLLHNAFNKLLLRSD
ncbi:MAG: aminotransferase class IV [Mangrovibacterium sp.]